VIALLAAALLQAAGPVTATARSSRSDVTVGERFAV
jgi:hypothetical protein